MRNAYYVFHLRYSSTCTSVRRSLRRRLNLRAGSACCASSCLRLRAVLLTSLTTIAGLIPILFEQSVQAQFLIPMATSIVFGLALGTFLILLVLPSIILIIDDINMFINRN